MTDAVTFIKLGHVARGIVDSWLSVAVEDTGARLVMIFTLVYGRATVGLKIAVNFGQKARRWVVLDATIQHTARGVEHVQLFAGPGHADVTKAALLLHLRLVIQRPGMRKQRFFHARHKHHRKFK